MVEAFFPAWNQGPEKVAQLIWINARNFRLIQIYAVIIGIKRLNQALLETVCDFPAATYYFSEFFPDQPERRIWYVIFSDTRPALLMMVKTVFIRIAYTPDINHIIGSGNNFRIASPYHSNIVILFKNHHKHSHGKNIVAMKFIVVRDNGYLILFHTGTLNSP